MTVFTDSLNDEIAQLLVGGKIGIIRTDTIYGIVARADNEAAVERIYKIKGRTPTKSPITLIGSPSQLFNTYDEATLLRLKDLWPGKNSVILPSEHPAWIVRGNASIAYRLPADETLRRFLEKTGPLVAPSANPEGEEPATTIEEAKAYFGDSVDFYVDGGTVTDNTPSKLYRLNDNGMERLR